MRERSAERNSSAVKMLLKGPEVNQTARMFKKKNKGKKKEKKMVIKKNNLREQK